MWEHSVVTQIVLGAMELRTLLAFSAETQWKNTFSKGSVLIFVRQKHPILIAIQ